VTGVGEDEELIVNCRLLQSKEKGASGGWGQAEGL
jgi:hypothetical protein